MSKSEKLDCVGCSGCGGGQKILEISIVDMSGTGDWTEHEEGEKDVSSRDE